MASQATMAGQRLILAHTVVLSKIIYVIPTNKIVFMFVSFEDSWTKCDIQRHMQIVGVHVATANYICGASLWLASCLALVSLLLTTTSSLMLSISSAETVMDILTGRNSFKGVSAPPNKKDAVGGILLHSFLLLSTLNRLLVAQKSRQTLAVPKNRMACQASILGLLLALSCH